MRDTPSVATAKSLYHVGWPLPWPPGLTNRFLKFCPVPSHPFFGKYSLVLYNKNISLSYHKYPSPNSHFSEYLALVIQFYRRLFGTIKCCPKDELQHVISKRSWYWLECMTYNDISAIFFLSSCLQNTLCCIHSLWCLWWLSTCYVNKYWLIVHFFEKRNILVYLLWKKKLLFYFVRVSHTSISPFW